MLLNVHEILLLLLLVLKVVYIASHLVFEHLLSLVNVLSYLILELAALHLADTLFLLFLSLSVCPLSGYFHVALAGVQDVRGALFGFIEFLPCLKNGKRQLTVIFSNA